MRFAVVAHQLTATNVELARRGWPGAVSMLIEPQAALRHLRPGDVALNRLDVLPTLSGVEEGLWIVSQLEANGVAVLNPASALLAAHDKLLTARVLSSAELPHPRTVRLTRSRDAAGLAYPVVAKPRFGTRGSDVEICVDESELGRYLDAAVSKPWSRAGAVAQELIVPTGTDLRLIVAGREVVGCARRHARAGEWRTNVALGAVIEPAFADAVACELAVSATRVLGLDLAGVDLLTAENGYVVVEVNGAVEFRPLYSQASDVFAATMAGLAGDEALVTP